MNQIELVLERVTPSSRGGFINTWSTLVATAIGIMFGGKDVKRFCNKSQNELPVGTTVKIDLDQFNIVASDFVGDDSNTHTTNWLHIK